MDILTKPLDVFSFADIVTFCGQQEPEGVQVEYKRDMTTGSVSKSIAALSNTRGGVIIIGVDENRRTGLPGSWNGIPMAGNHRDRIHQWASNVSPIPQYEVHITDEQGGNVFVLVRVFEGDNTPYYVQNDPHLWIRTGNISTPIDMAPPHTQAALYNKRAAAELSRANYINLAERIWDSSVKKAEKDRINMIRAAQANGDPNTSRYYNQELGRDRALLSIHIQPYYPHTPLAKPSEIQSRLNEIEFPSSNYLPFPSLHMSSIPEGLLHFDWDNGDGKLDCHQIYSTGFIQHIVDISSKDPDDHYNIFLGNITAKIFIVLKAGEKFYRQYGYNGNLIGYVLLRNIQNYTNFRPIALTRSLTSHGLQRVKQNLLSTYRWDLNLDTRILSNPGEFQEYFVEIVKDIYWQLGFGEANVDTIKGFLEENHWQVT